MVKILDNGMVDQPDIAKERYEGPSAVAGSASWWAAGHIIGIPVGGLIGGLLGYNEQLHQAVVNSWKVVTSKSGALWEKAMQHLPYRDVLASRGRMGAYVASGAAAGTFAMGMIAWAIGSGAEIRNAIRGRAQFDRLQDRVQDLAEENAALKMKADALLEQLKKAQQPTHEVSHVVAHEKHSAAAEARAKHDSHVAALALQNAAMEAAR